MSDPQEEDTLIIKPIEIQKEQKKRSKCLFKFQTEDLIAKKQTNNVSHKTIE